VTWQATGRKLPRVIPPEDDMLTDGAIGCGVLAAAVAFIGAAVWLVVHFLR
jgi:hypothetical protein